MQLNQSALRRLQDDRQPVGRIVTAIDIFCAETQLALIQCSHCEVSVLIAPASALIAAIERILSTQCG